MEKKSSSNVILFNPFPKQEEFINAALDGQYTFITYGGAIRGGKTLALLILFILLSRFFPGSRWALVRKDLPTIKRNVYPSWNKVKPTNFIKSHNNETHTVTFNNSSQIIFFPENYSTDKDLDSWKFFDLANYPPFIGFYQLPCRNAYMWINVTIN